MFKYNRISAKYHRTKIHLLKSSHRSSATVDKLVNENGITFGNIDNIQKTDITTELPEYLQYTSKDIKRSLEVKSAKKIVMPPTSKLIVEASDNNGKTGFFTRLKNSLVKTRQHIGSGFFYLFSNKKINHNFFEQLEEQLLIADVGVKTTQKIINSIIVKNINNTNDIYIKLKEEMAAILAKVESPLILTDKLPFIILIIGVNGSGKTTTIGKLARKYQVEGKTIMLAAGDTFRAAAVEQLQVWGAQNNIPVVAQHTGADAASVIFDAIQIAKAKKIDLLIIDTAGRLQNKKYLMEELKKIVRVIKKLDVNAPHELMLIIDASTGQNAISQTELFHKAVGLTGITLTKFDSTAKGGVIFSIADLFRIPIRYLGVGEKIADLQQFQADYFIRALFTKDH